MGIEKAKRLKMASRLSPNKRKGDKELRCRYWKYYDDRDTCMAGNPWQVDGTTFAEHCDSKDPAQNSCPRFKIQHEIDNPDPAFRDKVEKKIIGEIQKVSDEVRRVEVLVKAHDVKLEFLRKDVDSILKWRKEKEEFIKDNL